MGAAWGSTEHRSPRSCAESTIASTASLRGSRLSMFECMPLYSRTQGNNTAGEERSESNNPPARTPELSQLSLSKGHKYEPQRPAFLPRSPRDQNNEVYLSFDTQMRSPSSPSISPFISLFLPSPSNILVTSSHRGTPSLAFFGWCSFTQVLASAGKVIKSCCSIMMSTYWACPLPVRKRPEPLLRGCTVV